MYTRSHTLLYLNPIYSLSLSLFHLLNVKSLSFFLSLSLSLTLSLSLSLSLSPLSLSCRNHTLYSENGIPTDTDVGAAFSVLPPPARLRLYTKLAEEGKEGEVVGEELQTVGEDGDVVERPKTEIEVRKMMRDSKRRRQKFKGVKRKGGLMESQADLVQIMMSTLEEDQ
eukprot:sb/3472292/